MEKEIQRLLDSVADLRDRANVNAVFGEPVNVGDRVVIPVARVRYGFRMKLNHGTVAPAESTETEKAEGTSSDGAGAASAAPFAVVEVTPQATRVEPIVNEQKVALAGALLTGWSVFCLARALVKIFGPRD